MIKLKRQIKKIIKGIVEAEIEKVRHEGPFLVIYTNSPIDFYKSGVIGEIASYFKQRVYVRAISEIRSSINDLKSIVENLIEDVKKGAYRKEYEKNMKLVMERNKYIELSELIEKEVFSGKIRLKKGVDMSDYVMEYEFDENKSIEMHLTSSMV